MISNFALNRFITSFLTTSSLALISGLGLASDTPLPKEDNMSNSTQASPVLSTAEEMFNYGEDLFKLCLQKQFDEAFAKAFPEPLLTAQVVGLSDQERYTHNRDASLGLIYVFKGRKEQLNPEKAIDWYKKAIAAADHYLKEAETLFELTQRPDVINRIKIHKNTIHSNRKYAYDEWVSLIRQEEDQDGLIKKKLLEALIDSTEKQIDIEDQISELKAKSDYLGDKYFLFTRYITLSHLCNGNEKNKYVKKAKEIHQSFKSNTAAQGYFKKTSRFLKLVEKRAEIDESSTNLAVKSPKIQQIKLEKEKEKKVNYNTEYYNLARNNDEREQFMRPEIELMHNHLRTLFTENPNNSAIEVHLTEIENKIQRQLIQENLPSTLGDIYKQYAIFLGGETLRQHIVSYILPALLRLGNFSGALERVNILAELEFNQVKNNSVLTRYLRAGIMNLNGDYAEWQQFEQEIVANVGKTAAKKKRAKERQHEKNLEDIKETQENTAKAIEEQSVVHSKSPRTTEKKPSSSVEQASPREDELSFTNAHKERQAKLKHHEEAEKRRQEEEMSSSSQSSSSSTHSWDSTSSPQSTTAAYPSPIVSQSIKDLYDLTGSAKHTDEEIVDDTWKITRDQLIKYFEALGCTASNGGKHKKVSLPEALIITYEGETLTILNDLGGALTLPRWDGSEGNGTVPHYLRGQILKARTKLVQFKAKALQATQSSSSNTSGSGSH